MMVTIGSVFPREGIEKDAKGVSKSVLNKIQNMYTRGRKEKG